MNPANRFSVADYECLLADVVHVIDEARRATARAVNAVMTSTYWLIGRRIVEQEQLGSAGESLMRFALPWSHYVRFWRPEKRKRAVPSDWLSPRRRNEIS